MTTQDVGRFIASTVDEHNNDPQVVAEQVVGLAISKVGVLLRVFWNGDR